MNINKTFTQNICVNIAIGFLLGMQVLITMLYYPLKVGICGHASLAHDKIELNITLMSVPLARVRVKRENGLFKLQINGKTLKPSKKFPAKKILSKTKLSELKDLRVSGNLLALLGTRDAMTTALICAGVGGVLQPILKNFKIYTAIPSDTLEIDGRMKVKLNIMQIAGFAIAGLRG